MSLKEGQLNCKPIYLLKESPFKILVRICLILSYIDPSLIMFFPSLLSHIKLVVCLLI
jgi:hypothetical protein